MCSSDLPRQTTTTREQEYLRDMKIHTGIYTVIISMQHAPKQKQDPRVIKTKIHTHTILLLSRMLVPIAAD